MSNSKEQVPKLPIVYIVIATIVAIVAPFVIVHSYQAISNQPPNEHNDSFIIGSWTGTFDKQNVTLEFLSVENGRIEAQIAFPNNQTKKMSGTIRGNLIKLQNVVANNFYDGDYSGTFNADTTVYSGIFKNQKSNTTLSFKFERKNVKQNEIVGVWKGRYSGSGKVTLTINNDMTGVFDFENSGRTGSYKVSVDYSNGLYSVIGKEWIKRPSGFAFVNLNKGEVKNGKFSGMGFELEKTTPTTSPVKTTQTMSPVKTTTQEPVDEEKKKRDAEVNKILNEAKSAFGNGKHDDAFNLYVQASTKSTNGIAIKRDAAKLFFEKAKGLINTLGECDETAKTLLQYANKLNPSNDINTLLNLCD